MLIDLLHAYVRARFRSLGFVSRYLESDIAHVHYLVRQRPDSQPTLVLVHGLGTSSSSWLKILPRLDKRVSVIALDLPGFGFSTVKGERGFLTLREHTAHVSLVLSEVAPRPVVLLGQSLGGWICSLYSAGNPRAVQQLVLVDTAGVYYRGVEKLRDMFTLKSVAETRRLLQALWFHYPWYFKPFAGAVHSDLLRRHVAELVASVDEKDFLVEDLARLTMPVSIIWGKQDQIIPPESIEVFRRLVPTVTSHVIEDCGHVPQLERPKELAALLNGILGAL